LFFKLIGRKFKESKKNKLSTSMLRILLPSIMSSAVHLSSRNWRSRNCASYPRELWEITYNLSANDLDSRRYSINLPMGFSQNPWVRLLRLYVCY
jgi:hypothetical protein